MGKTHRNKFFWIRSFFAPPKGLKKLFSGFLLHCVVMHTYSTYASSHHNVTNPPQKVSLPWIKHDKNSFMRHFVAKRTIIVVIMSGVTLCNAATNQSLATSSLNAPPTTLSASLPSDSPAVKPWVVMIDAGHGGAIVGPFGENTKKRQITLGVALSLQKQLLHDPQFRPLLTRSSSTKTVSLLERSQAANHAKADVFLSIHANANTDPKVRGAEFYF